MTRETKSETLRVRVSSDAKRRLEVLAKTRHTDVSELARQALFALYPELAVSEDEPLREDPMAYTSTPDLANMLTEQTKAINALVQTLSQQTSHSPVKGAPLPPRKPTASSGATAAPRKAAG